MRSFRLYPRASYVRKERVARVVGGLVFSREGTRYPLCKEQQGARVPACSHERKLPGA